MVLRRLDLEPYQRLPALARLRLVSKTWNQILCQQFGNDFDAASDHSSDSHRSIFFARGPIRDITTYHLHLGGIRQAFIDSRQLTGVGLSRLAQQLTPTSTHLHFFGCSGTRISFETFSAMIPQIGEAMREFSIRDCPRFQDSIGAFYAMRPANLTSLRLEMLWENTIQRGEQYCDFSAAPQTSDENLLDFLWHMSRFPKAVNLSGCEQLTDACAEALSTMALQRVSRICLSGCRGFTAAGFALLLGRFAQDLNHLDVSNCPGLSDQVAESLDGKIPHSCHQMNLLECPNLSLAGYLTLLRALPENMESLAIGGNLSQLNSDNLHAILAALPPGLERLVLAGDQFADTAFLALDEHLPEHVQQVDLSGCSQLRSIEFRQANDRQVRALIYCLPPNVQALSIGSNAEITTQIYPALLTKLRSSLQAIDIDHATFSASTAADMQRLYSGSLTCLSIATVDGEGRSARSLAQCLCPEAKLFGVLGFDMTGDQLREVLGYLPATLSELCIGDNRQLANQDLTVISNALPRVPNLQVLVIGACPNISGSLKVRRCTNLEQLSLVNCPNVAADKIEELTASLPPSLRRLELSGTMMTNATVQQLPHRLAADAQVEIVLDRCPQITGDCLASLKTWIQGRPDGQRTVSLRDCPGVRHLSFANAAGLYRLLRDTSFPNLEVITLADCEIDPRSIENLARWMPTSIEQIDLSGNVGRSHHCWRTFCLNLPTNLRVLNLENTGVTDTDLDQLMATPPLHLQEVRLAGSAVRRLNFFRGGDAITNNHFHAFTGNPTINAITSIDATGCVNLTDTILLQDSPWHVDNLTQLRLGGCTGLTAEGLMGLQALLSRCIDLEEVDIRSCQAGLDYSWIPSHIRRLAVGNVATDDIELAREWARTLPPSLLSLTVDDSDATSELILALADALLPHLQTLSLANCQRVDAAAFGKLMRERGQQLNALDISGCTGLGEEGCRAIATNCSSTLKTLRIEVDTLKDAHAKILIDALGSGIEQLYLGGRITDKTLRRLSKAAPAALRLLSLRGCQRLTAEGIQAMLRNLPSMQEIDLSDIRMSTIDLSVGGWPRITRLPQQLKKLSLADFSQPIPTLDQLETIVAGSEGCYNQPGLWEEFFRQMPSRCINISLTGCPLDDNMSAILAPKLGHCRRFDVDEASCLTEAALGLIIDALPNDVRALNLSGAALTEGLALRLAPKLTQCSRLNLSDCPLLSWQGLQRIVEALPQYVSKLDLSRLPVDAQIAATLAPKVRQCTDLRLNQCYHLEPGNLFELLNKLPNTIGSLCLGGVPFSEDEAWALAQRVTCATHLELSGCNTLETNQLREVIRALPDSMEVLTLSYTAIDDDLASLLVPKLGSCQKLSLAHAAISADTLANLVAAMPNNFSQLHVNGTQFDDRLAEQFQTKFHCCRSLRFGDTGLTDAGFAQLARVLPDNIHRLQAPYSLGPASAAVLASKLSYCQELDIRRCRELQPTGALRTLITALPLTIRRLHMTHTNPSWEVIQDLIPKLGHCIYLNINCSDQFTIADLCVLAETLPANLIGLHAHGTAFNDDVAQLIAPKLTRCQHISLGRTAGLSKAGLQIILASLPSTVACVWLSGAPLDSELALILASKLGRCRTLDIARCNQLNSGDIDQLLRQLPVSVKEILISGTHISDRAAANLAERLGHRRLRLKCDDCEQLTGAGRTVLERLDRG